MMPISRRIPVCFLNRTGKRAGMSGKICLFPHSSAIIMEILLEGGSSWRLYIC